MAFRYDILLQVNILHSYFADGLADNIYLAPTSQTQALLQSYRLIFKNTGNGCALFTEKIFDGVNWVPIIPIDVGVSFNFFIYTSRNDFLNITEADFASFTEGGKFYFRNSAATPSSTSAGVTEFTVFNGGIVVDVLSLALTQFTAPVVISDDPAKIILRDADNNIVAQQIIQRNGNNEITEQNIQLSQTPFAENIYQLQQADVLDNVISQEWYFLTDVINDGSISGIFQIQYNKAVDTSAGNQKLFTAKLSARQIKWVYRIEVDQYPAEPLKNYDASHLRLNNNSNNVPGIGTFTSSIAPGPPIMVNFKSDNPITLQENAYKGISLIDKGPPAIVTIIGNLPNPDTQFLHEIAGELNLEYAFKIK